MTPEKIIGYLVENEAPFRLEFEGTIRSAAGDCPIIDYGRRARPEIIQAVADGYTVDNEAADLVGARMGLDSDGIADLIVAADVPFGYTDRQSSLRIKLLKLCRRTNGRSRISPESHQ